jgi:hypothetical protein
MIYDENDGSEANRTVKNENRWKNVKIIGTLDRLTKIACIYIDFLKIKWWGGLCVFKLLSEIEG